MQSIRRLLLTATAIQQRAEHFGRDSAPLRIASKIALHFRTAELIRDLMAAQSHSRRTRLSALHSSLVHCTRMSTSNQDNVHRDAKSSA